MSSTLTDLQGPARSDGTQPQRSVATPPRKWKTRVLLPGAILFSVAALLLVTSAKTLLPVTGVRVVPVVAKAVEGSAGTVTVQAPGWLEPDPHPYYVPALANGVVEEVLVLEGDRVKKDQVLARLISDDAQLSLQRAEAELLQRQSALRGTQAELTAAEQELDSLVERSRDAAFAEAALAEARAAIKKTRADIALERARLMEIRDEYERKSKLIESHAVSEATVARLSLRVDAQQASVDAALAQETVLGAKRDQAEADLQAARANLALLIEERRDVALAEAAVATAGASVMLAEAVRGEAALRLARMEVRSPVDGIILRRLVSPGSMLTNEGLELSSHLFLIYDPRHLQVRVDVPLADAAQVVVGQKAEITVEVLPDRTFTGRLTRLVHEADLQKNTVEVKVAIENPTSELKPEMLARVRFLGRDDQSAGSTRERAFAPRALIQQGENGALSALVVTSLVDDVGRVEQRSITLGTRRIDDWVEIDAGLQVGDLLVFDPNTNLEPGDRVRVMGEYAPGVGG